MTLAWQIANLSHAKKLPSLSTILVKAPDEKTQSWDVQKTMIHQLSKKYGGRVRKVTLHG